jgi:polar amino acid transport system permease protein
VIIPSLCTLAIYLVKDTSLASVIAVDELTLRAQQEVSRTFDYVPVFGGAAAIYLAVTTVIVLIQRHLEKRLDYTNRPPAKDLAVESEKHPSTSEAKHIFGTVVHDPSANDGPVVAARGIVKRFGDHLVLDEIDLEVNQGEVVCLIGPSGSGKTTMLRCLNNLEPTTAGVIRVRGVEMGTQTAPDGRRTVVKSERKRARARVDARIGMVFQQFNLFENMTVNDNLLVAPVRTHGAEPAEARNVASRLLAAVGLSGYGKAYPHQLSGGQQQRVAICRALATDPTVMLFDEPTSALDPEKVGEVLNVMEELVELGMTMIIATHEISFARRCATRVVFMEDGRIVEQGPPEQVLGNPAEPRTREFLRTVLGENVTFSASETELAPAIPLSTSSNHIR